MTEANVKMNAVCQKLYNELEMLKSRYADVDFTLSEKYKLEKERNESLIIDIEKWQARYQAL